MPNNDVVFDTEEFDRVYAAYTDSKRQLNQLRVFRGFFQWSQSLVVNSFYLVLLPQPLEANRPQGLEVQKASPKVKERIRRDQKVQRD